VEGVSDGLGADWIREDVVHVFGGLSSIKSLPSPLMKKLPSGQWGESFLGLPPG
jgi:hypothetical protein